MQSQKRPFSPSLLSGRPGIAGRTQIVSIETESGVRDVAVSEAVATVLAEVDPPMTEVLETDLEGPKGRRQRKRVVLERAAKPKPAAKDEDGAFEWEGPRFQFWVFLFSGRPHVPGSLCAACRGNFLRRAVYCLDCDRCGKDADVPEPSVIDLRRRQPTVTKYQRGKLKGGVG